MIFQPIDIALFLISFAACIYCMVLSRRLASLQNTKDGLGATITACTDSISSMSLATRGTTAQAKELAGELSSLLLRADEACQKVVARTLQTEAKHQQATDKIHAARSELDLLMRNVLEQHKKQVTEIVKLTQQTGPLIEDGKKPVEGSHQIKFRSLIETNEQRRSAGS